MLLMEEEVFAMMIELRDISFENGVEASYNFLKHDVLVLIIDEMLIMVINKININNSCIY